jgi:hypothetical protein
MRVECTMTWLNNKAVMLRDARSSRGAGRGPRNLPFALLLLVTVFAMASCKENAPAKVPAPGDARTLFTNTMTRFHAPSEEARGAERERLLNEASKGYNEVLKRFSTESNLCAQSLRALGSIHATQGKTNEAVKFYAAVGEKYASEDWEVLQAWKSAADLLWDGGQRNEAKKFYAKIVERFGKKDAPQIIQQVVRGSKARLAE